VGAKGNARPRLLDAFCGAGGAAKGYMDVGFHVTGVDLKFQPRYIGDEFIEGDALEYLAEHGREYDAIHASPPCQGYSIMHNLPWLKGREYPLLILPLREMLEGIDRPYVIENVMGARYGAKGLTKRGLEAHGLQAGYLCGTMFGLPMYRHRLFATNWWWWQPGHPKHRLNLHPRSERYIYGGTVKGLPGGSAGMNTKPRAYNASGQGNGAQVTDVGHAAGWRLAAETIGIDWMKRDELTQAIPPVFTKWIGDQLMEHLQRG
jgi:DNA (cytosine-5)-methyltransferase 1